MSDSFIVLSSYYKPLARGLQFRRRLRGGVPGTYNPLMTKNALIIAASDPSGGAGLEADLKVMAAHGVFAVTAVTAVTVQDSRGLRDVKPVDGDTFRRVLALHLDDQAISAVKIGALGAGENVEAVRAFLDALRPLPPVVLDPVVRASSGAALLDEGGVELLRSLLPLVALVTPNLIEAGLLTGHEVADVAAMVRAGEELRGLGAKAALVKGGHLKYEPRDVLVYEGGTREWEGERLPHEYHGTGCALASAIAAGLARGSGLIEAVDAGRSYLFRCMQGARPGRGGAYILDFPVAMGSEDFY